MSNRTSSKGHGCQPEKRPKSLLRNRRRKAITRANSATKQATRATVHADAVTAIKSEF